MYLYSIAGDAAIRVPKAVRTRRTEPVLRAGVLAIALLSAAACGHDASLQRETAGGGLVTFSILSESDVFSSTGRHDAQRIMQEKCPSGIHIVKEGEVPKVSQAADRAWGPQIGADRIWGIHFTCK